MKYSFILLKSQTQLLANNKKRFDLVMENEEADSLTNTLLSI